MNYPSKELRFLLKAKYFRRLAANAPIMADERLDPVQHQPLLKLPSLQEGQLLDPMPIQGYFTFEPTFWHFS